MGQTEGYAASRVYRNFADVEVRGIRDEKAHWQRETWISS
jgi:hypothetical protein